ncbi:hypothetical protein [Burkholderia vietnamiensis]|uniref:hypothetical protein n=1 Tax=Burkholderia vietnamiensis TaxID=60552 RepID=UPI0009BCFBD2|nr:hypothetical protein [Burkholderia vietnamiensis]
MKFPSPQNQHNYAIGIYNNKIYKKDDRIRSITPYRTDTLSQKFVFTLALISAITPQTAGRAASFNQAKETTKPGIANQQQKPAGGDLPASPSNQSAALHHFAYIGAMDLRQFSTKGTDLNSRRPRANHEDHQRTHATLAYLTDKKITDLSKLDLVTALQTNQPLYTSNSIIESRIEATRNLIKVKPDDFSDMEMLDLGNLIHFDGSRFRGEDMKARAAALLILESETWFSKNGGKVFPASREAQIKAYVERWDIALDPPKFPTDIKTRAQIAQEYFDRDPIRATKKIGCQSRTLHFCLRNTTHKDYIDSNHVKHRYYQQFPKYEKEHLPRAILATALLRAEIEGLSAAELEFVPKKMWQINRISASYILEPREISVAYIDPPYTYGKGYIFEIGRGEFIIIPPSLKVHRFGEDILIKNDFPAIDQVLKAYNATQNINSPYAYTMHLEPATTENSKSVKNMMTDLATIAIKQKLTEWKDVAYNHSMADRLINGLIPFYETGHKLKYDPQYHFKFSDIAADVVDLSITLGSIFLGGFGGIKGVRAAIKAVEVIKAAKAVGSSAKGASKALTSARAVGKSASANFNMAKFVGNGAKEIVDFVVPVFSAKDLVKSTGKIATNSIDSVKNVFRERNRYYVSRNIKAARTSHLYERHPAKKMGATQGPPARGFDGEPMRFAHRVDISKEGAALMDDVFSDIKTSPELKRICDNPVEQCAAAVGDIVDILKGKGFDDVRVRAVHMWKESDGIMPANHYLAVAKFNKVDYAVDITAGQLGELGIDGPLLVTEGEWVYRFSRSRDVLVKYKDFEKFSEAEREFGSWILRSPTESIENIVRITNPEWYENIQGN